MKKNEPSSIRLLFEPKTVAVIGASSNPGKIGNTIFNNITSSGYPGRLFAVNPHGGVINNQPIYQSLHDIEVDIDLATIVVPAKAVLEAVQECAKKKVKYIQIISSGFSEIGNTEEENKIVSVARNSGMRILGPNIFGLYSASSSMNATFSASTIKPGHVAILTQSGALGIAMIGKTAVENIGLSAIVSLGNKCDLDEADLLEYLIPHADTKVILMYIEGVKNGLRLIEALKRATLAKPIVVIKSGRSQRGALAAASHTGSLAGSDKIFDAIMKQCGVLRAENIDESFNWSKFLAFSPRPAGKSTVIITNGGGIGVMATDACEKYDIPLYDNQKVLKEIFADAMPSFGSSKNPVDITGGATSQNYIRALSAPSARSELDATIALYCETSTFDSENLESMIRDTYEKHINHNKAITYAIVGGEDVEKTILRLKKDNIPVYSEVDEAVSCLGTLYRYQKYLKDLAEKSGEKFPEIDHQRIEKIIDRALAEKRTFLLVHEGAEVMVASGIRTPQSRLAKNIKEAISFAEEIGYPLVMKVVSRDILHKSDAGGVALNLDNRNEVISAYEAIQQNCKAYNPKAAIDGIEISEMVKSGTEMIIGARRDPSFGPVVMCGLGGIYVEVMKDVVFRGFPLNHHEALNMVKEIKSFPLLLGVRGEAKKDIDIVMETIIKVGTIINQCLRITDIEINPLVVYPHPQGGIALDCRILIKNP